MTVHDVSDLDPLGIGVLGAPDLPGFLRLSARDPVVNVFAEYRARSTRLDPRWLGGEVWGRHLHGELVAACHVGANIVPVGCDEESARLFAHRLLAAGRSSGTLVGPQPVVRAMWQELRGSWEAPRAFRWNQPHLEIRQAPAVEPDPRVRVTLATDLDALHPAAVAMYTEEVGVSPEEGGMGEMYRARVRQLIGRGWSFARFDDHGAVEFKAEVAYASPYAAQVQGVWVRPDLRGRGIAAPAMAAVVNLVREQVAPVVSLYVNDFNTAARAAYERVGFEQTSVFATVMV